MDVVDFLNADFFRNCKECIRKFLFMNVVSKKDYESYCIIGTIV